MRGFRHALKPGARPGGAEELARLVIEAQSGRDEELLRSLYSPDARTLRPGSWPIDLPAVFVHEVEAGVVVAERQYWGLLEFLVQAGLIGDQPAPASP